MTEIGLQDGHIFYVAISVKMNHKHDFLREMPRVFESAQDPFALNQ